MTAAVMCGCPSPTVHVIVCRDGALLTLPMDYDRDPVAMAEAHAAAVDAHGGWLWQRIECPDCGRVYFTGMAI